MTFLKHSASGNQLTAREQQIRALICKGLSNKGIAQQLHLSEGTVKQHVHSILGKVRLRSRVEIIVSDVTHHLLG